MTFSQNQVVRIREVLQREFERNSQDNGYFLNEIAKRYEDGDGSDVAAAVELPKRIAELTADDIHEAATTYLNPANYVKVTLMPEGK